MNISGNISVRKVRVLRGRARALANQMNLDENDLVIVRVKIDGFQPPEYEIEKIEGNPVEYLQKHLR